jgi:hypothetical protein
MANASMMNDDSAGLVWDEILQMRSPESEGEVCQGTLHVHCY